MRDRGITEAEARTIVYEERDAASRAASKARQAKEAELVAFVEEIGDGLKLRDDRASEILYRVEQGWPGPLPDPRSRRGRAAGDPRGRARMGECAARGADRTRRTGLVGELVLSTVAANRVRAGARACGQTRTEPDPIPRAVARMFNSVTAWVDAQWGEWGASPEAAQGTRRPLPFYGRADAPQQGEKRAS